MHAESSGGTAAPSLLTVSEAADALRLSRTSLYRLINSGELRPVRINRRVLFDVNDLRELVADRKTAGRPADPGITTRAPA